MKLNLLLALALTGLALATPLSAQIDEVKAVMGCVVNGPGEARAAIMQKRNFMKRLTHG